MPLGVHVVAVDPPAGVVDHVVAGEARGHDAAQAFA